MASSYEAVLLDDIQVKESIDMLNKARKTDDLFAAIE